jgi:hypothetical protein
MGFVVALLVGGVLLTGCNDAVVKDDYMSLEQLQKTKKFLGYDIAIGPGLDGAKLAGPFRLTGEVNADVRIETRNPFHRRVKVDDTYYEFKLTEDVIGYGYRFLSVRNRNDELGILVLKTKNKVPSWDRNAEGGVGGVLLTEREKREREQSKKDDSQKGDAKDDSDDDDGESGGGEGSDEDGI